MSYLFVNSHVLSIQSLVQDSGETLLTTAAVKGHAETTSLLLQHGAVSIIDERNAAGNSPLVLAAGMDYWDVVSVLVENGAATNMRHKVCAL